MEVRSTRSLILAELSAILETPVAPETVLAEHNFDSMVVVMMVGFIDDACGLVVDGIALAECKTAGDILRLAGIEP